MLKATALINIKKEDKSMVKVQTFAAEIKIFHTVHELSQLDDLVNKFISENNLSKVISVSDPCTTDDTGSTIGVIRVVAYEES